MASPGQFVRTRRLNAGFSHEDVALRIETDPRLCALDRAQCVDAIEKDLVPIRLSTAIALQAIPELDINLREFAEVIDAHDDLMRVRFVMPPTIREAR